MKYNIYISSHFESKPPYDIVEHHDYLYKRAFMWKSDETVWHYIGSSDSLDDIRYTIENNKQSPKNKIQRKNIITALKKNANNYFVNGNGLTELVKAFL